MYLMRNHDVWIYVRCANSDPCIAFDRLYDLIDEAAGHGFLVRGTSFDHCSGNTLKDRIGLRSMLDAVENGRIEAVMVRDLEQISRNSYILVGVIEILRQNDVYLITTECDLNAELINSGLERFVGDRFTRASMNIREEIFLMPDETPIDLLRILIWYDWEHEGVLQLATSRTANTPPGKTVGPIIYSEQLPLNRLLLDWADKKHSLSVRKITRADYLEWMLQWPPRLP